MNIFVDDIRIPTSDHVFPVTLNFDYGYDCDPIEWTIFRDPLECYDYICRMHDKPPQRVSLDHDLQYWVAGHEVTGMDLVKGVVEAYLTKGWRLDDTMFYIHSQNIVGKENIVYYLKSAIAHQQMES